MKILLHFAAAALLLGSGFSGRAQEAPANKANATTTLDVQSADLPSLIEIYEKLSGKTIITEANIAVVPNIRISVKGEIPEAEAMRLIESVLMLNGYALVPAEDNSIKVINSGSGKNPRSEGINVYANLADLPKGDQVVTYFMQFQNIGAQEALSIFQAQVPAHPWGYFVAVPHAQALIVTENAFTIRQLAKIKELIDIPSAKLVSRFVVLQRADAERVADIITKLIETRKGKSQESSPPPPNPAPQNQPNPNGPAPAPGPSSPDLNERNLVAGDVQLVADARTNRILVVTRPVNFDYIRGLIEEFDRAVVLTAPLERPLKYVTASEVLPVLETMLSEDKDSVQSGATGQSNNRTSNNNRSSTNRSSGSGGTNNDATTNAEKTLQERQDTAPEAVMVGKTRLIADNQANSIIVIGPPESVGKVRAILDTLDKKPMQVYLSTVIGQLTLNDSTELAVDILKKYTKNGDFGTAASSRGRSDSILEPSSLTTSSAFTSLPTGLTIYGTIGSAIDYYVKALASTNRFKLISRPVVYTANNKGALIASGQRIAVPTSSLTSIDDGATNSGSVVSNIEYTDVELRLEVIPLINSNREVTLQIKQTNDSVVGSTEISGNSIPTIGTQVVDTTVTVPNKSTIVLGGLITEDNNTAVSGIPVLMDIPVLGYLFKGTTKTKNRSELIIMIQPTVVGENDELVKASQEEVDRNKFGPEAKAFSDNVPFVPAKKKTMTPTSKSTPASSSGSKQSTPRGLTPAAPPAQSTSPLTPNSMTPISQ